MSGKHVVYGAITLALVAGTSGCIHGYSQTTLSGNYVGASTFERIEVGQTTESWVRTVMGEPTRKTLTDDGEIWAYTYERIEKSRGSFFLIGGSEVEETQGGTYIKMRDGVVVDAWRE